LEKKKDWENTEKTQTKPKKSFTDSFDLHPQQKAERLLAEAYASIKEGHMLKFQHVFEQKSEIDILDMLFEGNTLLHHCVTYNRPKMALVLLGDGAKFIKNSKNLTPVDMVRLASDRDPTSFSEIKKLYLEWE